MSILIDHCVPLRYLRLLQQWGYEAHLMSEYLAVDALDSQLIAYAHESGCVLLTVDKDFSNILDFPPQEYSGIVVLRYKASDEAEIDATLKQMLEDLYPDKLPGVLVIVSPGRYRTRH
jgi:predicted nuclease of predicted toxin-antitoxin system